jgi:PilZ domain-containing protein
MAEANRPYDRRRTPRISVRFPVKMTWNKKKFNCQALEFSEFGILLESTHKELVGQDVEVGLAMDSREGILSLKGIVAYASEAGLGVRFKDITEQQGASLKNYVLTRGHNN